MPVPTERLAEPTASALRGWLGAREVTVDRGPEFNGYSHETIFFDADGRRLVARVAPTGYTVFDHIDLRAEFEVMRALRGSVPIPAVGDYCDDASVLGAEFFVMERLDGEVASDNPPYCMSGWLYEASPAEREAVWWSGLGAMAAVHACPAPDRLPHGDGGPALSGQLDSWERYADGEDAVPVLREGLARLREEAPADREAALCWGDARIGNQMFEDGRCVAVLDWEMATVADPEQDLAWFCFFDRVFSEGLDMPRLDGIPTSAQTVARYEQLTGRSVRHFDYYTRFAAVRFGLIMMRLGRLMFGPGNDFSRDNFAVNFVNRC